MLRVAACDNSREDIELLECAFDDLNRDDVEYDVFFKADELLKAVIEQNERYDMYLFEIEIPEMNGLELAGEIRRSDAKALFVFLTGHTEYVMDVFDLVTFDYIKKPITKERLADVLQKAVEYLELTKRDFVFQYRKNHFRIYCDDILYIEKSGRQAFIHTASEVYKTNMTTEEVWKQLDTETFFQIHLSFIANLRHIKAIDGDEIVMSSGERLLVARAHKQELKEKHKRL